MVRKQNKIQGVVSDEMLAQWKQWKEDQGFKSDGQALNALLLQFFSSGEPDITSDNALREQVKHLETLVSENTNLAETIESTRQIALDSNKQIEDVQENLLDQGDRVRALERRVEELEQKLSQTITNESSDKDLSQIITKNNQDETEPSPTEKPLEDTRSVNQEKREQQEAQPTYTSSELAKHIGITSRTLREQVGKLEVGEVYSRNGEQWKLIAKKPKYQLRRIRD